VTYEQSNLFANTDPEERPKKSYRFLFIAAAFLFVLSLVLTSRMLIKKAPRTHPARARLLARLWTACYSPSCPRPVGTRLDGLKLMTLPLTKSRTRQSCGWQASDPDTGELLAREPSAILALWNEESGQWNLYQKMTLSF
jgi:hypothetical protein